MGSSGNSGCDEAGRSRSSGSSNCSARSRSDDNSASAGLGNSYDRTTYLSSVGSDASRSGSRAGVADLSDNGGGSLDRGNNNSATAGNNG